MRIPIPNRNQKGIGFRSNSLQICPRFFQKGTVTILMATLLACGGQDDPSDRKGTGGGLGADCTINEWTVTGMLGEDTVDAKLHWGGGTYRYGWSETLWIHGGLMHLWGDEEHEEGDLVKAEGLFFSPKNSFAAGKMFYAKSAELTVSEMMEPIHLDQLHEFGKCPGTAVEGTLSICFTEGFQATCPDDLLSGTINGRSISIPKKGETRASVTQPEPWMGVQTRLDEDGFVVLHGGEKMIGYIMLPSSDEEPLSVYCVDEIEVTYQDGRILFALSALSRAGAPPGMPVKGHLDFTLCKGF